MNRIETIQKELADNAATYAGLTTDQEITDVMNAKTKTGKHETLHKGVLFDSFDPTEWATVQGDPAKLADVERVLNLDDPVVLKSSSLAFTTLESAFGTTSATISNIKSARKITTSIAQDIGLGKAQVSEVKFARTGAY